ncbi:TPA: ATP-binding domain-containing protein [Pseudomonas aeruginosa]|nr:ATP-binding domain-containing protein [Pseudomonas aeruginosa]
MRRQLDQPRFSELLRISNQFQYQVLVDEATDFSALQLACMESLSDPRTRSFFACGDFNQRITGNGLRNLEQLKWISARLRYQRINTVYRQSRLLNAFAIELLSLMGGDLEATGSLPEHSTHEGVMPVLAENLDSKSIYSWLADRIGEIERQVREMPSIAVLVPSEEHVKLMAEALTEQLESINLRAVACVDGQTLGDETDVRVFDMQHIKGLEFEAVFFVGVDELATTKPELFERYLYVGATRAATYLGVTCHHALPARLKALQQSFVESW